MLPNIRGSSEAGRELAGAKVNEIAVLVGAAPYIEQTFATNDRGGRVSTTVSACRMTESPGDRLLVSGVAHKGDPYGVRDR